MSAHIDETLVGIMLDALHELIIVIAQLAHSDSARSFVLLIKTRLTY